MIGGDLVKAMQISQERVGSCFELGDIAETFYLCHVKLETHKHQILQALQMVSRSNLYHTIVNVKYALLTNFSEPLVVNLAREH